MSADTKTKGWKSLPPHFRNAAMLMGGMTLVVVLVAAAFISTKSARPLPVEIQGASLPPAGGLQKPAGSAAGVPAAEMPRYDNMVKEFNKQHAQQAELKGTSAFPTPTGTLQKVEVPVPQSTEQKPGYTPPPVPPSGAQQQLEAQRLQTAQAAMSELINGWSPKAHATLVSRNDEATLTGQAGSTGLGSNTAGSRMQEEERRMIGAGEILAAEVVTTTKVAENSGDVLAIVRAGKWTGAKVIGKAKRQGTLAEVGFTLLSTQEATYKINAYAIDASTQETGVASDVNHHVFERFVLRPTLSIIDGLGQAVSRQNTQVTVGTAGVTSTQGTQSGRDIATQALGHTARDLARDVEIPKVPTVKLAPGEIIGIVFLADMTARSTGAGQGAQGLPSGQGASPAVLPVPGLPLAR